MVWLVRGELKVVMLVVRLKLSHSDERQSTRCILLFVLVFMVQSLLKKRSQMIVTFTLVTDFSLLRLNSLLFMCLSSSLS